MNPRFERFLKETAVEKNKRERAEKKAAALALKAQQALESGGTTPSDSSKKVKKPKKASQQKDTKENNLSWSEEDLFTTNEPNQNMVEKEDEALNINSDSSHQSHPTDSTTSNPSGDEKEDISQISEISEITTSPTQSDTLSEEPKNLLDMYRTEGDPSWLGQGNPATKAAFNLINKALHPDRPLARGVAVLAAKGTSFEDKRLNCLNAFSNTESGESTGEIYLKAEPENIHDSNAVAIYDAETHKMLGYIPKAHEVNKTYGESLAEQKFCGGYIIDGKRSQLKGEENAMLLIATGWI